MKKTKKKIRLSGVIFMLLTIYLLGMLLYYFITLPVKSINIKGNSLLTDSQIISESKIDYNNSIFKLSTNKIKNNIKFFVLCFMPSPYSFVILNLNFPYNHIIFL